MQKNDAIWLVLIAVSLGLGVVGGQYLKKDELLPICHAIAPGLFPPLSVALPTNQGVFDSTLQLEGQPWQISFVGPSCDLSCRNTLIEQGDDRPGLVVSYTDTLPTQLPLAVGNGIQYEQAAEAFGLRMEDWSKAGYVGTWLLNADHHIEARLVVDQ